MKLLRPVSGDYDVDGYRMNCPGCGDSHTYWTKAKGKPLWSFNGDINKPTFCPSLRCQHGRDGCCHFHVTDGMIKYMNDCTHALAGQTVPMVPFED